MHPWRFFRSLLKPDDGRPRRWNSVELAGRKVFRQRIFPGRCTIIIRKMRAVICVLEVLLGVVSMPAGAQEPKLELAGGSSSAESQPAAFSFRFEIIIYLMPLETGSYQFSFKPYTPPGDDAPMLNTEVSGDIVQQDNAKSVQSIQVQVGGQPVSVKLEARKLYTMTLASLMDSIPADKSASVTIPLGLAAAILAPINKPAWLEGVEGYINVPVDCSEIRSLCGPRLSLISPGGVRTDLSPSKTNPGGESSLAVPAGEDGQVWKVGNQTRGVVGFTGQVPPLINLNSLHFLLPPQSGGRQ